MHRHHPKDDDWIPLGGAVTALACSDGLVTKLAQRGALRRKRDPSTGRWRYLRSDVENQRNLKLDQLREEMRRLTRGYHQQQHHHHQAEG
jgi:hypothetical protein